MIKLLSLSPPGSSSFFLFLSLGQNSIKHYLLYVGTFSKIVTIHLLLLMGISKGEMRFLDEVTGIGGVDLVGSHYQTNSACYP